METTTEIKKMVQSTAKTAESIEKSETTTETETENADDFTTEYTKDFSTEYADDTASPLFDTGSTLGSGKVEQTTSWPNLSGGTETEEMGDEFFGINRGGAPDAIENIGRRPKLLEDRIMGNSSELARVKHIGPAGRFCAFCGARTCWDQHVLSKAA